MSMPGYEQFSKMNPFGDFSKIAVNICQRVTKQNLELMEENMLRCSDQLQRLSKVKRPEEWLSLQANCISEDVTAAIENVQKIVHMSMENVEELSRLASSAQKDIQSSVVKDVEKFKEKSRDK